MSDLEGRLAGRLAALSLEQKVRLLTGADHWSLRPAPEAGLRRLVVSDGPAGVRGEVGDERDPSANVPSPTALAATWDEARVRRVGRLLAAEARRKGVDVLLAPTVNLHRSPYGGRHFECFSEDPLLTARIGVAYVRGLQEAGVGAAAKHFVANDSETERKSVDARIDERTLRELYLAPFEALVREGGVWAVMAAYNGVNGHTMTESPLLREVLREEWGFDGVIVSDWFATRSTEQSANAGLDLVMPGPDGPWGQALLTAVREGRVPGSVIDEKARHVLRLAARAGALDGVPGAGHATPYRAAEVAAELRAAAAAGFVLARNDGLLPLAADRLRAAGRPVAVLGPNAGVARTLGGGSATVVPPYTVSPLAGIRAALGAGVRVTHAPGLASHTRTRTRCTPAARGTDEEEIARAVALAREADVAVVVVGTTAAVESEGFDRASLALPGRQDDLVRAVAAANPRTVVVVNTGAPVLLPWHDETAALLLAWFPGQECGNALADVLLGRAEPGGRLPTTWPLAERDLAEVRPAGGVLRYGEGLAVGYRGEVPARYPFGHGLGYTTWEYLAAARDGNEITVRLANTGTRAGREVVQVYASRPGSAIPRPARWLAGFAAVAAGPGEEAVAVVTLPRRAFEHWDAAARRWAVEPGPFRLEIGPSSAVRPLRLFLPSSPGPPSSPGTPPIT